MLAYWGEESRLYANTALLLALRSGTTAAPARARAAATRGWRQRAAAASGTTSLRCVFIVVGEVGCCLRGADVNCGIFLPQLLDAIQSHLGVIIPEIAPTMDVPVNEFDGQVRWEIGK